MTVVESVLAGIERLLLPKLDKLEEKFNSVDARFDAIDSKFASIQTEIKSLRDFCEIKFKTIDQRFDEFNDKLDLHKRMAVLEERQQQASKQPPKTGTEG